MLIVKRINGNTSKEYITLIREPPSLIRASKLILKSTKIEGEKFDL